MEDNPTSKPLSQALVNTEPSHLIYLRGKFPRIPHNPQVSHRLCFVSCLILEEPPVNVQGQQFPKRGRIWIIAAPVFLVSMDHLPTGF
jgi:hypothetical protein